MLDLEVAWAERAARRAEGALSQAGTRGQRATRCRVLEGQAGGGVFHPCGLAAQLVQRGARHRDFSTENVLEAVATLGHCQQSLARGRAEIAEVLRPTTSARATSLGGDRSEVAFA